jgi:beta-glucuronidase
MKRDEATGKPYPRFATRRVQSLNGMWDFIFLGEQVAEDLDPALILFTDRHPVPSSFDAMPDTVGKRGLAAYRTFFSLPPGRSGLIEFEGIGFWGRVFIDGKVAGEIRHGWTPFSVNVSPSESAGREILVLVDNRFDFARSPLHEEFFDFHHWGGITRSVWMHELPETYIQQVNVRAQTSGRVEVEVEWNQHPDCVPTFDIDGQLTAPISLTWSRPNVAEACFTGLNLSLWRPAKPNLHTLRVSTDVDDFETRFGVRTITAKEGKLFLNGENLELFGVNRHESHPQYGSALPLAQLVADLQLIRDLGGNFVRGSHYPQDQRFLDLCDEMGMLVWEEGVGWGQRERQLTDPDFRQEHAVMMKAMMRRSINHPAIIIWGFLNEAGTNHPSCRPIFEETVHAVRALDPTRLVASATMFPMDDLCYDLFDIVSANIYPGWYGCEDHPDPLALIRPRIAEILAHLHATGHSARPFILSEIGVEALPGWHDAFDGFFTEEFQASYLDIVVDEFLINPALVGLAIWHFSDARTYRGGRSLMRPRAFNNKGIFDEYRRPKRAVEKIRSLMTNHNTTGSL